MGKVGDLDYDNPLFIITNGVRLGDFFFCLEKRTPKNFELLGAPEQMNQRVIGAFKGGMHYQFINLEDDEHLVENYMNYLIRYILEIDGEVNYSIEEL